MNWCAVKACSSPLISRMVLLFGITTEFTKKHLVTGLSKILKKTSQLSANIRPHHIAQGALSAVTAMLSPSGQSSAPPEIFGLWRISTWNGSKIGVPISNGPAKFIKIGHCSYSKHNFWELAISIIPPIWLGYHFAPPDRFRNLASGEAVSHRNKFGKYLQTSFQLQQRKTSKF